MFTVVPFKQKIDLLYKCQMLHMKDIKWLIIRRWGQYVIIYTVSSLYLATHSYLKILKWRDMFVVLYSESHMRGRFR